MATCATSDELLNEPCSPRSSHARAAVAGSRPDYNTVRPCSSIGNLVPPYAKLSVPASQRDGTPRDIGASRPSRCSAEPGRLKWPTDSTHPWMRKRAQVTIQSARSQITGLERRRRADALREVRVPALSRQIHSDLLDLFKRRRLGFNRNTCWSKLMFEQTWLQVKLPVA
jgi:hypothetical protein